jgi:hypothetical protein
MAGLPPVTLVAHILSAFLIALLLRGPLEKRYVKTVSDVSQPKRQFFWISCWEWWRRWSLRG